MMRRHQFVFLPLVFSLVLVLPLTLCDVRGEAAEFQKREKGKVIELDESNWEQILKGEWMVEFHAPWCPACRDFQPEFKRFAEWDRDLGLKAGAVDVHAFPGLSGRFLISALPTIYHVRDGEFRQYTGIRDRERMMRYIEDQDWKKNPAVSPWIHPTAVQMGVVGQFFKLSMHLKNLHTWMVETKGIPNWLTYVIFAVATITMGGAIGVVLVLAIEFVTGSRKQTAERPSPENAGKITTQKKAERSRSPSGAEESDAGKSPSSPSASGSEEVSSEGEGTEEEKPSTPKPKQSPGRTSKNEGDGDSDAQVRRRKARRED